MLRTTSSATAKVLRAAVAQPVAIRAASTHAISKPTLANIEKRWEGMPLQEQAELWMALRDRMKENWADLTLHEKKAGESCLSPSGILACIRTNQLPASGDVFWFAMGVPIEIKQAA
jgi:hypothetical protein